MSKNKNDRERRQRRRLWQEQGGRCYWCGCLLVMPVAGDMKRKYQPPNEATIDHLFSRLSPDRGKVHGRTHVLACFQCNGLRSKLEVKALILAGVDVNRPRRQRQRLARQRPAGSIRSPEALADPLGHQSE